MPSKKNLRNVRKKVLKKKNYPNYPCIIYQSDAIKYYPVQVMINRPELVLRSTVRARGNGPNATDGVLGGRGSSRAPRAPDFSGFNADRTHPSLPNRSSPETYASG